MHQRVQIVRANDQGIKVRVERDVERLRVENGPIANFQFRGDLPQHSAAGQPGIELTGEAGLGRGEADAIQKVDIEPRPAFLGLQTVPGLEDGELSAAASASAP